MHVVGQLLQPVTNPAVVENQGLVDASGAVF